MGALIALILMFVCFAGVADAGQSGTEAVHWQSWSDAVFRQAQKENKFVLLDLEAVWCHWCHVMDHDTYSDPAVAKLINQKFIAVKVDQDSRPDLSNRYEDYGWPATIVFNAKGGEIIKRSGFINPKEFASVLAAIIKDPTPGPSVEKSKTVTYSKDAYLSAGLRKELQMRHQDGYDNKEGGWGSFNKFLDWDSVEYAMSRAKSGDEREGKMARTTLAAQMNLLDPVWGGVYQYSTDGDWKHPHFEKIMQMQAEDMRIYSLAYMLWHDPAYLQAAKEINSYLTGFLMSPDGAFYTSQDADLVKGVHSAGYFALGDEERRKQGIPRIDKHIYARENGWAINALAALYAASGDAKYLQEAQKAAAWVIANRSLTGGGFRHDSRDSAGPYLGDTAAMGRAFVSLYNVTADRTWLSRAQQAADFIAAHFEDKKKGQQAVGFATSDVTHTAIQKPQPLPEENMMMVRFANLLYHDTGKKNYRQMAEIAMRYLATPEVARKYQVLVAGTLIADDEMNSDPAHITVVGPKADPQARSLFMAAIMYPSGYKRVEWYDRAEGALPNMDVEYPEMKRPAAFACADRRCSLPAYKPEDVAQMVDRVAAK